MQWAALLRKHAKQAVAATLINPTHVHWRYPRSLRAKIVDTAKFLLPFLDDPLSWPQKHRVYVQRCFVEHAYLLQCWKPSAVRRTKELALAAQERERRRRRWWRFWERRSSV
jgi:hypothetical protein